MKIFIKIYLACAFILIAAVIAMSQPVNIASETIGDKEKKEVIESISKMLTDNYVFPDKASEMTALLREKLKSGSYDDITSAMKFGDQLTKDLQSVSHDKHLNVLYSPKQSEEIRNKAVGEKDDKLLPGRINSMKQENFGFKKVEILPGNIGYIDLRYFAPEELSKETIAGAMSFVANSDALIIDLRNNGGGDPSGVRQICSYFFGDEPVHLNDLYYRPENKTDEYWTVNDIQGKKLTGIDLYVLTSGRTFSGAEEFSYNLKNLKRATIIGETTGGGAHPGDMMAAGEGYVAFVPTGRAINPITKTNWEGTGVIPDIDVKQEKALLTAQQIILEKISGRADTPELKDQAMWLTASVKAQLEPVILDESSMNSYTGKFGERTVKLENGELYYQRADKPKMKMIPMMNDLFRFEEVEYARLRYDRDSSGNVLSVTMLYDNGQSDTSQKN